MKTILSKRYRKPKRKPYLQIYWEMLEGPEYAEDMVAANDQEIKKAQQYRNVLTGKVETVDT